MRVLEPGEYTAQLTLATTRQRTSAALEPPEAWLTIMVASPASRNYYNETWSSTMSSRCGSSANFPLALRQQKQGDEHQLYYSYPLIKVSPEILASKPVLQTYHFRVNVTSRLYFEVGMHLVNSHVTLQLTTLGGGGQPILGKQRGNLNVLDIQVGPGDYSVAIKQAASPGAEHSTSCGLFSLQGLAEPTDLMSAAANSGEIRQRGITSCPEAADGDVLPAKIYGSKSATRGGGELHVDATGHFMRRFRNVLFKHSRAGGSSRPEYDFIELDPAEDSLLHLAFLYDARAGREIRVTLADTWMMGQAVTPQAVHKQSDIEGGRAELVTEFWLTGGRHYALNVQYLGGSLAGEPESAHSACSTYDLTFSIAHSPAVLAEATCRADAKAAA